MDTRLTTRGWWAVLVLAVLWVACFTWGATMLLGPDIFKP